MLTLLYSGRVPEAWCYFEQAWPDEVAGKSEFRSEFEDSLLHSTYWPAIAPAFGAGPCGEMLEHAAP